jgi:hypothetical protein
LQNNPFISGDIDLIFDPKLDEQTPIQLFSTMSKLVQLFIDTEQRVYLSGFLFVFKFLQRCGGMLIKIALFPFS